MMFQGGAMFLLQTISQYIFPMSYSKRMPALMAAAAGNDITVWLSDFTGLLRFPRQGPFLIYDFVIRLFSAMFYCEKDKPMCQRKPVRLAGTLRREFCYWRPLCESGCTALLTPLCLISESASYAARKQNLLWWLWIYGDALLIVPKGQEVSGVESGGLLHRVLQNL